MAARSRSWCAVVAVIGGAMKTDDGELTKRQRQVLEFCWAYWELNLVPPTRVEISRFFGFASPNAAETHLRALARKGVLELRPKLSRGIRFLKLPDRIGVQS